MHLQSFPGAGNQHENRTHVKAHHIANEDDGKVRASGRSDRLPEKGSSLDQSISILGEILLQIDAANGREEILQVLRNETHWLLAHDICFISIVNSSRTHYTIHALSPGAETIGLHRMQFVISEGMPGWAIQHQAAILGEVSSGPTYVDAIEGALVAHGMQSVLIVPLRTAETTIGSFTLCSERSSAYREQEMCIAQLLAYQVAIALKNTTSFDDARKQITQIELVNQIAQELTSILDLDELLHSAAQSIQKSFNYFDVSIFLVNTQENEATLVARAGNFVDFLPHGYRQSLSEGFVGWVASYGQRVLANDVSEDPRYRISAYRNTKSELALPIFVNGEVAGVLNIEDEIVNAFDDTDAIVLETLCGFLGSIIKNARLHDQVKKANMRLTELDRLKTDFISIVSHDFRSPLASIILAAKGLMRQGQPVNQERLAEYLNVIIDKATRLSHLAEDTLSMTKMEAGQLSYFFKRVNLKSLIHEASSLVEFSRRHSLEYTVDPGADYVKGDDAKLRQVLQNLLSNAVKYSPRGGMIRVRAENYSTDQIIVLVSDEGIGIPTEQMDRLFEKFCRINTIETRSIKGSGLGLWICREIVRSHGGQIWVESQLGKGSTFRFTLRKA